MAHHDPLIAKDIKAYLDAQEKKSPSCAFSPAAPLMTVNPHSSAACSMIQTDL